MANIAQLVNVLQAPILTEGDKMVCTPTYYVFKLFMDHQENELLESHLDAPEMDGCGQKLPALQQSASVAPDGTVHVTLVNPSLDAFRELRIETRDMKPAQVSGEILTGQMDDHNTFDEPEKVKDQPFSAFTLDGDGLTAVLPPCSVVHLAIR